MKTFREIAELHYAGEPTSTIDAIYRINRANELEKLLKEHLGHLIRSEAETSFSISLTEEEANGLLKAIKL